MIYPMTLKLDFGAVVDVGENPKGSMATLFVNWLVKPFLIALPGRVFFKQLFVPPIGPQVADQRVAEVISLAAAHVQRWYWCEATSWMALPAYPLAEVAVNDRIRLAGFAPIRTFLV